MIIKKRYLTLMAATLILMGVLLGAMALKETQKYAFEHTSVEMLANISSVSHSLSLAAGKNAIDENNQEVVFVDIRTPKEFVNSQIPNAINIPYDRLLEKDFEDFFENSRKKVLYDDQSIKANAAWMVLTQYGYENLFVLEGGLDGWKSVVDNKDIFKGKYPIDEDKGHEAKPRASSSTTSFFLLSK